jgi:hypothetical protein
MQVARQAAVAIGAAQPLGGAIGVVLVVGVVRAFKVAPPKRRIHFRDGRAARGNVPAVERPEVHATAETHADEAQPGDPGMR